MRKEEFGGAPWLRSVQWELAEQFSRGVAVKSRTLDSSGSSGICLQSRICDNFPAGAILSGIRVRDDSSCSRDHKCKDQLALSVADNGRRALSSGVWLCQPTQRFCY